MFSYGENVTIHLNKSPITQLIGPNGHGKSSIPLIIEEILFSTNSRKIKKAEILNRYADSNVYEGWITFEVDGDQYKVVMRRTSTQTVKLYKNGEDISMHTATATYKLIEKILGIDSKSFEQLIYQRNSASLEFLTATDTVRKRFLIELLGLSIYTEYFDLFKDLSKEANDSVTSATAKIETVKKWLSRLDKETLEPKTLLLLPVKPNTAGEIERLKSEIQNIESINKSISQNNQYKKILDSIDLTILSQPVEAKSDTKDMSDKAAQLNLLMRQDKELETKLKTLGDTCPTCLQRVSEEFVSNLFHDIETRISTNSAVLECLSRELKQAEQAKKIKEQQIKVQNDFERYSQLYDKEKATELLDKLELQTKLNNLLEESARLDKEITNIINKNTEISGHNSRIEALRLQAEEYKLELTELNGSLIHLKNSQANLELLKKVFSTTGFIAYKLENLVIDLQNITNEYLSTLSSGRFELTFEVENDKLNVHIVDNGNIISIEALSSGELARVNTATLLAIRKLMSSISKTRINLLVLDETIDTLDQFGKEQLIEILLSEPELNTFIVSHGFTHPLLDKIMVLKEKNISRLE